VVRLSEIRENPVALRNVNRAAQKFQEIVDSVREDGIINPPSVRFKPEGQGGALDGKKYELIDGLHRYTAALEVGLETIPVNILNKTDEEALVAQVVGNIHKVETRPTEYTRQLMRILAQNPTMTQTELAARLSVSPQYIEQRLSLNKLDPKIGELVDAGHISLNNAFPMTKLPVEQQTEWVDRAMRMGNAEFGPLIKDAIKKVNDLRRTAREGTPEVFKPQPHSRKPSELKEEYTNPTAGPSLVAEIKPKSVEAAFALGIAWAVHMDPRSQAEAIKKHKDQMAKTEEEKKKREAEKTKKRADEAAAKQGELNAAAAAARKAAEPVGAGA
jgi:ParB/RepB/Spo0J family partition protein